MSSTWAQRSFSAGEISPKLYARCDQSRYATGLRTCRNLQVMREGGAESRPGTEYIAEANLSRGNGAQAGIRLVPFIFSLTQTYILEFGYQYIRFYRDGEQITEVAVTISGVTQANPCIVTAPAHGYSNGDEVVISGVVGMTQVNGRNFKVSNVTTNTFEINDFGPVAIDSTGYSAYVSGGTAARVYTLPTFYSNVDLPLLQFTQSFDVITIVHPNYSPQALSRILDTNWTLAGVIFAPSLGGPPISAISSHGVGGDIYCITAIAPTGEESLPGGPQQSTLVAGASQPISMTWLATPSAIAYRVYKASNGIFGLVAEVNQLGYTDTTTTPSLTDTPPTDQNPFTGVGLYPSAVTYFQQRLMFANSFTFPQRVWGSQTGNFYNFTTHTPILDSDSLDFTMVSRQSAPVAHLLDLGNLLIFTGTGEWEAAGDSNGAITPTEINPTQHSYNGCTFLRPLVIDGRAIYVQARGSYVRDLGFDLLIDGYRGNDLSIFSTHLFDGHQLVDWDYQQIPHSIVWAVREDGVLLGMTYVKDQQMVAWHRHDTLGQFLNVAVVPEGSEDVLYVAVQRMINGTSRAYIERLTSRLIPDEGDITDSILSDATLTLSRAASTGTLTLSGGTTWNYDEELTLTGAGITFTASNVGQSFFLTGSDGTVIKFLVDAFSSGTVVTGRANKLVPVSMRAVAISSYFLAVSSVGNLWHLEGQKVSVMGDGYVLSSPNDVNQPVLTVQNGTVTLPAAFATVHVGLPYLVDYETLDIDTPDGQTMADKAKQIGKVSAFVYNTRGVWAGLKPPTDDRVDPLEGLTELKIRDEEAYNEPVSLATKEVEINVEGRWNKYGRVFIRQVDPLPMTILAVYPGGYFPQMR